MICKLLINDICTKHNKAKPPEAYCLNKCKYKEQDEHECDEFHFDDKWCRFEVEGFVHFHLRTACDSCELKYDKLSFRK